MNRYIHKRTHVWKNNFFYLFKNTKSTVSSALTAQWTSQTARSMADDQWTLISILHFFFFIFFIFFTNCKYVQLNVKNVQNESEPSSET